MAKKKNPSELRFDLISKDWVIIATGRAKRPEAFKLKKRAKIKISKKKCPFCNIETQKPPLLIFSKGKKISSKKIPKDWTSIVIPNKYPALLPQKTLKKKREGKFYQKISGIGYCELVITRDHKKHFPHFELWQIKEVIDCYQLRYLDLMKKPHVAYVSIFHNHGAEAGASQPHPHSQIITTPLIDVDLLKALLNSKKYFEKTGKCIYCQMNKWEMKVKKRIIFENEDFLVLCPFASRSAFQTIISPKKHASNFEKISEKEKWNLAEAFKVAMTKLYKALDDPPYNFYLHTAPVKGKHPYYHWHFTILPKTATPAGFELGTRMEICVVEPEKAAQFLKKQ